MDTYQNHRAAEDEVHEEISGLREPRRGSLEITAVCEEEVWIQDQSKLRARDEEVGHETPYLRHSS